MKIGYTADIYENSGLRPLLSELDISSKFVNHNYGNNNITLIFGVNCLLSHIKERRPRLDNKAQVLYWDIMLDYKIVKKSPLNEKKIIVANSIISSFDVLDKYKKLNLDKNAIKEDAKKYFLELGWL